MKVPLKWLQKYIDIASIPLETITDTLISLGIEVEGVSNNEFSFESVVTVRIEEIGPHENADRLQVTRVFDGTDTFRVVCGDPSIQTGDIVPLAKVGAVLCKGMEEEFAIQKSKIRGVVSEGMLCAKDELKLAEERSGVWKMDPTTPLGRDLKMLLYNPVIDVALTPNLGHARSVLGIARELSAALKIPVQKIRPVPEEEAAAKTSDRITCENRAPEHCSTYFVRIVEGVYIEPSPPWMQEMLALSGIKPVNNVVDVLNYVMHEVGQPMHAFDLAKIAGETITIELLGNETEAVTLDGKKRTIPEGTLVIADKENLVACAGIMGMECAAVSSTTHSVVIESALFDSRQVRKDSKALSLRTDSQTRFENGIDPQNVAPALDYATALLKEIAGGKVLKRPLAVTQFTYMPKVIICRLSRIHSMLGVSIPAGEIETIFTNLDMRSNFDGTDTFQVKIPSFRGDLHEEIDLIEEVMRLYGLERFASAVPYYTHSPARENPYLAFETSLKNFLTRLGMQEVISCSLISPQMIDIELEHGRFQNASLKVLHAKSMDQSVLRPSLLPGLLDIVQTNQNVDNTDLSLFEIGNVFLQNGADRIEKPSLGILQCGSLIPPHFSRENRTADFFSLKGTMEMLFTDFIGLSLHFEESRLESLHPYQQLSLIGREGPIGFFGRIHPDIELKLSIKNPLYYAEIDVSSLFEMRPAHKPFAELPAFPFSERDFTFTLPCETSLLDTFKILGAYKSDNFDSYRLLSVYTGDTLAPEYKNVTFRFRYRNKHKTLSDTEIEAEHLHITDRITKRK